MAVRSAAALEIPKGESSIAVILGSHRHAVPRIFAAEARSRGIDVVFVRPRGRVDLVVGGIPVLCSELRDSPVVRRRLRRLEKALSRVEKGLVFRLGRRRYRRFMEEFGGPRQSCSVARIVPDAISMARFVRTLRPRFVFGNNAFLSGLATALCRGYPRILMPWGGDIYDYAEGSLLAFHLVKHALRSADLICPSAVTSVPYICGRFGVSSEKVRFVTWGVKRSSFERADDARRAAVCERYGIDPGAVIVLNSRRLQPSWGSSFALESFLAFAEEHSRSHYILLGGGGNEPHVRHAIGELQKAGLARRFTVFEGEIPLTEFADIAAISDIFVSFKRSRDMRALSVLQPAHAGASPVLTDQEEYREMERKGFRAEFVRNGDLDSALRVMRRLAGDSELRRQIAARNREYVREFEDFDKQMDELFGLIEAVCGAHRSRLNSNCEQA